MTAARVMTVDRACDAAAAARSAGRRVMLVVGVFDLLHVGHARAVAGAADGARVVIAVRDDADAARRLGAGRPVLAAEERARLAAALRGVDAVAVADAAGVARLTAACDAVLDAEAGSGADPFARVRPAAEPGT